MAAVALPIASMVLGGIGLVQQAQAQKKQADLANKAIKAGEFTKAAQQRQFNIAENYDPAREDAAAITNASNNANTQFRQALGKASSDFSIAGGQPTGDTAFNISASNLANRAYDPLKDFQANLESTRTARKSAMYNPVVGAPVGQLANSYFTAANMSQPNYGPSLSLFTDSLKKLFAGAAPSGFGSNSGVGSTNNGSWAGTGAPGEIYNMDGTFGNALWGTNN